MVTSVLQTPAGRMIFGRPEQRPSSGTHTPLANSSGSYTPVAAAAGRTRRSSRTRRRVDRRRKAGRNPRAMPVGFSFSEGDRHDSRNNDCGSDGWVGVTGYCVFADNSKANSAKEQGDNEERAVKAVNEVRKAYQESLHKLYEIYMHNGDKEKVKWVEEELKRLPSH